MNDAAVKTAVGLFLKNVNFTAQRELVRDAAALALDLVGREARR